jgi:acyl carrier protein
MSSLAPDHDAVVSALRSFLANDNEEAVEKLHDDDNLFESGVLDSLQLVSLIAFIDDEFGLSLDYDDLTEENLGTLSAIRSLIARKRAGDP